MRGVLVEAQILIVDDDRLNLALLREIMLREGHTVKEATSGEAAVELALGPGKIIIIQFGVSV